MTQDQGTGSVPRRALHILIEGRVQGVGFRAFVDLQARRLALGGWVRNRRDGAVEAVIAGPVAAVERMLALCREGPAHAQVDMLRILDEGVAAGQGFEVRPTV